MSRSYLMSSDSIYNMIPLWDRINAAQSSLIVNATYGGNTIGGGLFEVADETQAYVGGQWVTCTRGRSFSDFEAFIFEFGRNDSSPSENSTEFRKAYDKVISQALAKFPKVVSGNCPPRSDDQLSWNIVADGFDNQGHRAQVATVAAKYNTRHVDTYTNFLNLVTAGTYTIAQLMRDTWHPTYTYGSNVIADAIIAALNDTTAPTIAAPEVSGRVVNYLFGAPASGTWTTGLGVSNVGSADVIPRVSSLEDQGLTTKGTGNRITFPATKAHQVWAHCFMRNGTGGSIRFYIDRGTGAEVSQVKDTSWVYEHYPQAFLVAGNLSAGTHTIEAETTTGEQVTVIGITVVGAD